MSRYTHRPDGEGKSSNLGIESILTGSDRISDHRQEQWEQHSFATRVQVGVPLKERRHSD